MGGCRYRVFLKKWPGPQTGVHLREVSASGGSTVLTCAISTHNHYSYHNQPTFQQHAVKLCSAPAAPSSVSRLLALRSSTKYCLTVIGCHSSSNPIGWSLGPVGLLPVGFFLLFPPPQPAKHPWLCCSLTVAGSTSTLWSV